MFTPPADLPVPALTAVLKATWSLTTETLIYRPVGFGSHHWELTGQAGEHWFVTVDDLRTRRIRADEPLAENFGRLRAALSAAQALRAADREFVLAPLPALDGQLVARLGEFFAVAVYPFVEGESRDTFTPEHRRAVLGLLIAVHSAPEQVRDQAVRDDYAIPFRDTILALLDGRLSVEAELGPYTQPATELLISRSARVRRALSEYDDLLGQSSADFVLTHGEPHPGNTMCTQDGWLLIDWDTALAAPPERDLWDLDPGDGTLYATYTAATGRPLNPALLDLYRRRWDLTEIGVCLARFCEPHSGTADDEETWTILEDLVTRTP